jgi:hypothetical protein
MWRFLSNRANACLFQHFSKCCFVYVMEVKELDWKMYFNNVYNKSIYNKLDYRKLMPKYKVWQCEVHEILTKTRMFDVLHLKIVHLVKVDYIWINITMLLVDNFWFPLMSCICMLNLLPSIIFVFICFVSHFILICCQWHSWMM